MTTVGNLPKDKKIIPPKDGWKDRTFYWVNASFNKYNPISRYMFYSGFISNGVPCGYNRFFGHDLDINDAYYLEVIMEVPEADI